MHLIITILMVVLQVQDGTTASTPATEGVQDPQTLSDPAIPTSDRPVRRPLNPERPPLLREGTLIARATGSITFDDTLGCWVFSNETRSDQKDQAFSRRFLLLPSRPLEDLAAYQDSDAPSGRFEVYGTVTVYDGVNFLLPSFITPLGEPATTGGDATPEATEAPSDSDVPASPSNTLDDRSSDIATDLEVRLQDRVGFLPMSIDSTASSSLDPTPGLIADGTRLQNRAGTIVRDQRTGAWRFLFQAQGPGERDPSIELLPCLHLQTIESLAMRNDLPTSIHASGVVTTFKQRNYLLISLWRPAHSSRNLVR